MDVDTTVSPLRTLEAWIAEARARGIKDPDAMALATTTSDGHPSVRVVLCRGLDDDGIRFFTNYESRKARELSDSGRAAVVFHWRELERQVRVEGDVSRTSADVSEAYFASRPRGNQIASSVSPQSRPIESMESLQQRFDALEAEHAGRPVPKPAHWGGFTIRARAVELWRASPVRLHERILYERRGAGWVGVRLAP